MKIPKKLEEKRDLFIESRYSDDLWPKYGELYRIVAKESWNDCANLLLPEIEKLSEVITILGDKHIGMAMCFEKHGTRLNIPFLIDDCKNDAQRAEKALQSLREFMGSDEKD